MKKCVVIVLVILHFINSSLYATNSFASKNQVHQHKHSHSQASVDFIGFFNDAKDIDFVEYLNIEQIYIEIISFVPKSTITSLFRPPII